MKFWCSPSACDYKSATLDRSFTRNGRRADEIWRLPWIGDGSSRIPLFWRLQILGWILFGFLTMPLKVGAFGSISYSVIISLFREPLGLLLTSLFRLAYRRIDIGSHRPAFLAAWVIGLGLGAGAIDTLLVAALTYVIQPEHLGQTMFGVFSFRSLLYCVWSFLYFWIRDHLRATERLLDLARAETAARNAELLMLRAQVAPHFLFNALNTIIAGLDRQPAALAPTVQGLADYFRYSLTSRHDALVTLGEEFDAIMNYLMVEKARFRDSLVIDSHLDPRIRRVRVPGVFLQPLVENAIKYGYQTSPTPLRLRIRLEATADGGVALEVANSGEWVEPRVTDGSGGNGLAILHRRLELLYEGGHTMEVSPSPAGDEVVVKIHLPAIDFSENHR